ncbi:MAG TPA: response regulator transcription factor [Tissierellia bacterium]|jgi:DNA-binding response OmpR family regulator|nr:response regulator transcription factor [Tissierellia bacterium]
MDRILIVDDEPILLKGLKFSLNQEGYKVETALDAEEALEILENDKFDLMVLDVMLPGMSGIELCKTIRETSNMPVIMLTARGDDESKILGLEAGADDYMSKPFNILELKARIKAILRRVKPKNLNNTSIIEYDRFSINFFGRKVVFEDREVTLTAKEFDLLLLLVLNEGTVFSREELLEKIWGYEYFGDVRTVDVHIRRLREKVEADSSHPEFIMTKWGTGYYFKQ